MAIKGHSRSLVIALYVTIDHVHDFLFYALFFFIVARLSCIVSEIATPCASV